MASVISYELVSDTTYGNGFRRLRYLIILEDNNSQLVTEFYTRSRVPPDFDEDADMPVVAAQMLLDKAEQEVQSFIEECRDGRDPLHDWVGFWEKSSPAWNTWDDAARGVLKAYLAQEEQLELIYIEDTMGKISNSDVVSVLGVTNQNQSDIRADIQVAVNTQDALEAYERWFDEDGNLLQ